MKSLPRSVISVAAAFAVFLGAVLNPEYVKASESEADTAPGTKIEETADGGIAWENYGETIYNTTEGLMSNNVSSVTQTGDGIVWIGTDKGLVAFDGNEFTEYGSFYHFDGINDMVRTSDGGVWFATTTYGGAVNLGSRFQHFDDVSESASNYATSISEGSDGYIYVGTLKNMLAINPESGYIVTPLEGEEYYYVTSIASGEELTAAVTVNGDVVFVKDAVEVGKIKLPYNGNIALAYADGYFIAGIQDSKVAVISEDDVTAGIKYTINVPISGLDREKSAINGFFYDDNRLWVLADDAIGYFILGSDGIDSLSSAEFYMCSFDGFESGFTDMMVDYQGNYWISSSKRGVLLLGGSDFTDELAQTGIDIDVVNAILEDNGIMYAATDSGIVAVDTESRETVSDELTENFSSGIIVDIISYRGKKYAAVYGQGIFDEAGSLIAQSARINRLMVVDDMLYVLTDEGCIVLDGEKIVAEYDGQDGMYNLKLSSAVKGAFGRKEDDRLYLASHGAGIYVFAGGLLEEVIDENSGLPSKNVNDMAQYGKGFFAATDKGVAYYDGKKAFVPENMPESLSEHKCEYIYIYNNKLYAVCESALYLISLDGLFEDDSETANISYEMYDRNAGFYGTLTDGGHGFMGASGRVYIPCESKVYSFTDKNEEFDISQLKLMIQSVSVDKRITDIAQINDNEYEINLTKDAKQIDILCSVLNFSNEDPYVRYIMPGVDTDYTVLRLSELGHIIYKDISGGSHVFWFELLGNELDEDGKVIAAQTVKLTINKEQNLLEKLWFRMVLLGAAFGILMFFVLKDRKKADDRRADTKQ